MSHDTKDLFAYAWRLAVLGGGAALIISMSGDIFDQLEDIAPGSKDEVEFKSPNTYACAHEGRKAIVTRSEGIVTVDFKGAAEGDISIQYPEMSWADYTPKPDGNGGYEYEITPKSAWPGHVSDAKRHCYGNTTP